MEYRSYKIFSVVAYSAFILVLAGIIAAGVSRSPSPDYSPVFAFLGLFAILGIVAYFVSFKIMGYQLDRNDGAIPMPGWLGAIYDIEDDRYNETDETPGRGDPESESAQQLVKELEPDSVAADLPPAPPKAPEPHLAGPYAADDRVVCPECGTTEESSDSHFCRTCGAPISP